VGALACWGLDLVAVAFEVGVVADESTFIGEFDSCGCGEDRGGHKGNEGDSELHFEER